ncbi:MAG TPA: helicase-exonuclease AddAB subunit AddA [Verrucomicrobiae bacterium]
MNLTPAQSEAVQASGNTLVIAGAGTGKTKTLIERCLRFILHENVSIDEILMVTFTEAAAAEMRRRIRQRLEQELAADPYNPRLHEQLALLENAHISTLHSFCLKLVREHFYELGLDPQITVLAEEQTSLLQIAAFEEIFSRHYSGATAESAAVQLLLQSQFRSRQEWLSELVLQLHTYTQTRPDPHGWFEGQLSIYSHPEPTQWSCWLVEAVQFWREMALPLLIAQSPENTHAHECAKVLEKLPQEMTRSEAALALKAILEIDAREWPNRKKTLFRKPLTTFFKHANFLQSLLPVEAGDPLAEDWNWVRSHMTTLLRLAREFDAEYSRLKHEQGAVDFHDLEQFSLRLLWDSQRETSTPLAQVWRERLKLVFVDEYQDINEAQDRILTALARAETNPNRFLVGDVKQSIYRFRQAAPHIFQGYAAKWNGPGGRAIFLPENFRSHEALLGFINPLFAALMRKEIGGVPFTAEAQLRFGDAANRAAYKSDPAKIEPRVEMHLRLRQGSDDDSDPLLELSDTEREARLVAERINSLVTNRQLVWDKDEELFRPVEFRDIVVLMRSPKRKVETFAKEFARSELPLETSRIGFFDTIEVLDLLNVLQLLDNPLQDVPAIAVLRSPLAGLSLDDLVEIRLTKRNVRFWTALELFHHEKIDSHSALWQKIDSFLFRFYEWRAAARHSSLTQRLEMILNDTKYLDWLLTQPRGQQRQANVQQLLALAREFDELHHQGVYRFLQLIEAQQQAAGDREPAPLEAENAVRLMSIHQSKGLEFPIVIIPDLGKRFNLSEATTGVILDDICGLCPMIKPPHTGASYPSLPYWLAKNRRRADALGEELRTLYVGLTRAEQHLILLGTCSAKAAEESWPELASENPPAYQLLKASSFLDWLGPWCTHREPNWLASATGANALWRWNIQTDGQTSSTHQLDKSAVSSANPSDEESSQVAFSKLRSLRPATPQQLAKLKERLEWLYPFAPATRQPAKASVTMLRRQAQEDESPGVLAHYSKPSPLFHGSQSLGPRELGIAHHTFLQRVSLDKVQSVDTLKAEAERLVFIGALEESEAAALDLEAIVHFWHSSVGNRILSQRSMLHRELGFNMRLTGEDAKQIPALNSIPEDEFIVVQGIVDLAVIRPTEIWLLDFKTDAIAAQELSARTDAYAPQIKLYSLALGRIYKRPVTESWLHFLACRKTVRVR